MYAIFGETDKQKILKVLDQLQAIPEAERPQKVSELIEFFQNLAVNACADHHCSTCSIKSCHNIPKSLD